MDMSKDLHRAPSRVIFSVALGIFLIGILLTAIEFPVYRADVFMRGFRGLQVGYSTFEDVRQVATQNGGVAVPIRDPPAECSAAYCQFNFTFYNTWLQRLKLAPDMWFVAFLTVKDNELISAEISMVCNKGSRFQQVFVRERHESHTGEAYKLVSYYGAPRLGIEMSPDAPPEKREAAFQVNVSCLAKVGGCTEPHDRIPAIPANISISLERER